MLPETESYPKGPISWMARNNVAANLLLFIFVFGGIIIASQVKQEVFPEYELDIVQVNVEYPGASPEEVEEGIILAIEDEVRALDGIKKVTSTSFEGRGIVNAELLTDSKPTVVLQDVKNAVDKIQSFPEEAERPVVSLLEPRRQVISLIIYGNQDKQLLRALGEEVRDKLIQTEGITLVDLVNVPDLEISIEVPERLLRSYNLTLGQISEIIRNSALDLPAGGVKTPGGEILLRTKERRDFASEFDTIPIVSNPDGSKVVLRDIASVREVLEETDQETFFNGKPAVRVDVYRVGEQSPLDISEKVHDFIEEFRETVPEGISIMPWNDRSEVYRDRIDLLLRNGGFGLMLVLLLLGLFLEPRLAFWVTMGIPVSVIGSFLFIPWTEASINMISLFAFIVTLGIIVDDAILVGENIYHKREQGLPVLRAAIEGARQMCAPVCYAVFTNIAAFIPLMFVPGATGKLFLQIPAIVVSVFIVSLIESLFVLPAHLGHPHGNEKKFWKLLGRPSIYFERGLKWFIANVYVPVVDKTLKWRYLTLTISLCIMVVVIGIYFGGRLQLSYLPRVDSDLVQAQAVLPYGIPIERSRKVLEILESGVDTVLKESGGRGIIRGVFAQIGSPGPSSGPANPALQVTGSHLVSVQVYLVPSDQRHISGAEFASRWRDAVGEVLGTETLTYSGTIQTAGGQPIDIQLSHPDTEILETAAKELSQYVSQYKGVTDVDDGVSLGKYQLSFKIKPEGRALGITANNLAQQVRASFYGDEALRQVRGRNEMKVMVRLPEKDREKIHTVEELTLRTPQGGEIPLFQAADVIYDRAYTNIKHAKGRRVISVTADVEENKANATEVIADVKKNVLPGLLNKYEGLSYDLEGEQREQAETLQSLAVGFLFALGVIYTLLAIPFKSYFQPLIVMMSIPFGIIGAIIGHLLLGYEMSIISMFGLVALSGVVVNDSLVLVMTINANREDLNMSLHDAVIDAGARRFRPIILTSLTTFFGLSPMIFETSMQARFLIPMAISLGFGVLFSTVIILLITTSVYLILEDVKGNFE